eukprot:520438-Prorocentrum_minimum.AAC.1
MASEGYALAFEGVREGSERGQEGVRKGSGRGWYVRKGGYRTCRMITGYQRQRYLGTPGARLRVEYLAGSGTQDVSMVGV